MKTITITLLVLGTLGFTTSVPAQSGGSFDLGWNTIDGGGGVSIGGAYSVAGTIGQPEAGMSSGGSFTLVGGFWGLTASVQAPAPSLRIERITAGSSGPAILITWPNPSVGWQLQENPNLGTTGWVNVTTTPLVVGNEKQVIIAPPTGNKFYRLKRL